MRLGTVSWPALLAGLAHVGLGQGHGSYVPDPFEASYAYLSTALALDPCGSEYGSDWSDEDSRRAIEQARATLPHGACETDGVRGLMRLQGSCNGMLDIPTSAQANMGEYHVVHYRYDGT